MRQGAKSCPERARGIRLAADLPDFGAAGMPCPFALQVTKQARGPIEDEAAVPLFPGLGEKSPRAWRLIKGPILKTAASIRQNLLKGPEIGFTIASHHLQYQQFDGVAHI